MDKQTFLDETVSLCKRFPGLAKALSECDTPVLHAVGAMAEWHARPLSEAEEALVKQYDVIADMLENTSPELVPTVLQQRADITGRPATKGVTIFAESRKAKNEEIAKRPAPRLGLENGAYYRIRVGSRYPALTFRIDAPDKVPVFDLTGRLITVLVGYSLLKKSQLAKIAAVMVKRNRVPSIVELRDLASPSGYEFYRMGADDLPPFLEAIKRQTEKVTAPEPDPKDAPPTPKRKRQPRSTAKAETTADKE